MKTVDTIMRPRLFCKFWQILLILTVSLLFTACAARRPPVPAGEIPAPRTVTVEDEQYGHQVLSTLSQQFSLDYDHPRYDEVLDIVDKLTTGIGANAEPWHVHVFKHESFRNAAATRGNHIFIWTPMIDATKSEGELATILSHEIAHVLAGHTEPDPQEEINRLLIGLGAVAAGIAVTAVTKDPTLGQNLGQLTSDITQQIGEGLFTNPYSRDLELEADQVGLMVMAKSGFNPQEAVTFWARAATDPNFSNHAEFFSTHPIAIERQKRLEALLPRAMEAYRNPNTVVVGLSAAPTQSAAGTKSSSPPTASVPTTTRTLNNTPPASTTSSWKIGDADTTVFDSPSTRSRVRGSLAPGTPITVIGPVDGWIEIRSPLDGFIRSGAAEPTS